MSTVTEQHQSRGASRLPVGVYLLAFSLFAMGSAEFLVAGVLPSVAADLDVSLSAAGALITVFALGVVLGGPPFAVLSLRWPRRTALMTSQLVFAAAIAVGLVADYRVLLITRFVAGLAYAGFFAVAAVTAISLVTPDRNARASGVVVSGLSVAMVAGGPLGTLLSNLTEWRGGFWAVVVLTIVSTIACALGLPATKAAVKPSLRRELTTMRKPRLWSLYAVTILSTAAYMISFNYLAAILADVTGVPALWIPAVLSLFGIGAFIGLSIGGRISDRRPRHALLIGATGIAILSSLLATLAGHATAVVPIVFLLGIAAFVLNPAIYGRVFTIAADAPTLAGATTVSAFQLGISLTPVFAAAALHLDAPVTSVSWIGVALALATVPLVLLDRPGSAQPAGH
ncbi:MFS transporter [Actinophytocola algeriensis]|uniref:DHA1 family chloramphenicol resistance protein-like MFS transporter n=1 Tax=Actinophytocola algeriensis TaxID=1768010 RepID=A0A7W7VFY1_9PSEU|nr:MFS transporter [Actinophytocola algeriensis]MBB4908791.1 DHA1 family chloramphenicol resistance protein-like MFS transporter [Actinophytocola algeriensis]MBE1474822.1 DHA1 family chloramphenicol resistance protein-like MFS transporter [Actinophytocola algeriensis]